LNLLEKSIKSNRKIKFINISTDKAVKPISVLGFTKRISEIICSSLGRSKSFNTSISTVRFGNVFGSDGSVVNIFIDKINNNQIVPITDKKAERFFMSIAEACNLIISASLLKKNGSTYIFNMGKPVKILDLYKKIFFIKKFKDKNLKMKIKFIGLQKGEKLKEKLLLKKKMNKTKIQDVYEVFDPIYSRSSVIQIIDNIKKKINTSAESRIIEDIKIFLKNEIN
jgi:FlaA1/EpsC-like NDP-sugar epimerase